MKKNILTYTDSYKISHSRMMPEGTEIVYSYLEPRKGAELDKIIFFGLQYILKEFFTDNAFTYDDVKELELLAKGHFPGIKGEDYDIARFYRLWNKWRGKLPVSIKALPEGSIVSPGTCLMTVENTDNDFYWLTNYLETILMNVWYPISVASYAYDIRLTINEFYNKYSDQKDFSKFVYHNFGSRSSAHAELQGLGGMAHLLSNMGTDNVHSLKMAHDFYGAEYDEIGYSCFATEHSVACSYGEDGEFKLIEELLTKFPNGILSLVSDTYSIERAIKYYCNELRDKILARNGKFVVRMDSPRWKEDSHEEQILWIVDSLANSFGNFMNSKGYKILNPKIGSLDGDGLQKCDIIRILQKLVDNGYAPDNVVFGMGGELMHNAVSRDFLKFAMKCSAQKRNGQWYKIQKKPMDASKASKAGKMKVIMNENGKFETLTETHPLYWDHEDKLIEVFRNGKLLVDQNFADIRKRVGLLN